LNPPEKSDPPHEPARWHDLLRGCSAAEVFDLFHVPDLRAIRIGIIV
jgi:hypothetical protein